MISVLNEHEHVIDCVKWAPPEACNVIDHADYNKNQLSMLSLQGSQSQGNLNGTPTSAES